MSAAGTIEPAQRADLSFPVPGSVNSVSAAVGAKIAKGTVLATIDNPSLPVAVTAASASVTAAQQQVSSLTGSSAAQVEQTERYTWRTNRSSRPGSRR